MAEITPYRSMLVAGFFVVQSHLASPGYFQREAAEALNEQRATAMLMAEAKTAVHGAVVPAVNEQEVSAASPETESDDGLTVVDELAEDLDEIVGDLIEAEVPEESVESVEEDIAIPPAVNDNVAPPGVAANDNVKEMAGAPAPTPVPDQMAAPVAANDNPPAPETPPAPEPGPVAPTTSDDTQV